MLLRHRGAIHVLRNNQEQNGRTVHQVHARPHLAASRQGLSVASPVVCLGDWMFDRGPFTRVQEHSSTAAQAEQQFCGTQQAGPNEL